MTVYKRFGGNVAQSNTTIDELTPGLSFKGVPDTFYIYVRHDPSCVTAACYRTYVFSGECEWGDWQAFRQYGDGRVINWNGYNGWLSNQC